MSTSKFYITVYYTGARPNTVQLYACERMFGCELHVGTCEADGPFINVYTDKANEIHNIAARIAMNLGLNNVQFSGVAQEYEGCVHCGSECSDLEGFDGLCGDCADRADGFDAASEDVF